MTQHPTSLREDRAHGSVSFRCGCYQADPAADVFFVTAHWHDELEMIYFEKGGFTLEINLEQFRIESECLFFIRSGELHRITSDGPCIESAVVFSPYLLDFIANDDAQEQLILPLIHNTLLLPRSLAPGDPAYDAILAQYHAITRQFAVGRSRASLPDAPAEFPECTPAAARYSSVNPAVTTEPAGNTFSSFDCSSECTPAATVPRTASEQSLRGSSLPSAAGQLLIKAALLNILGLCATHKLLRSERRTGNESIESIKTVLTYINTHYAEKIRLSDLAGLVNLNEQYFCRFFKKAVGQSPVTYLNGCRIRRARQLLLETNLPVTEVCLSCGFNNLGNFLREFRRQTGTTPQRFRLDNSSNKSK